MRLPGFGDQREIELLVEAGFTPVLSSVDVYRAVGISHGYRKRTAAGSVGKC
jgi:hypothetical protein